MQTFVDKLICYSQYCNQLPKSSPLRLKKKIMPDFFIPILHLIKCFKLSLKYGFCIHMLKHVALVLCLFLYYSVTFNCVNVLQFVHTPSDGQLGLRSTTCLKSSVWTCRRQTRQTPESRVCDEERHGTHLSCH